MVRRPPIRLVVSNNPKCAIYARVSTDKQADQNISIPDQIARARVYADMQGWDVAAEYIDAGASGRDDAKRPNFRSMIAEALKPSRPFDFILVHSFSRFYRNQPKSELIRQDLKRNRVQVRSLTQEIIDDGAGGTFALSIMALMDEYQSRENSKHVRRAMEANARAGFRNGGTVPFGYRLKVLEMRGDRPKHGLGINPHEAEIVRSMFHMASEDVTLRQISRKLNNSGMFNRKGNKWQSSNIGRVLRSETYIGKSYFRGTDPITQERMPKSEWILVPCEPIVDEAMFYEVQQKLAAKAPKVKAPRETTSNVLLGGIARCGSCDSLLLSKTGTGKLGRRYRYYRCSAHLNYGHCPGNNPVSIADEILDNLVLETLAERLFTPTRLQEIALEISSSSHSRRQQAQQQLHALKDERARIERELKNLWGLASSLGLGAADGFRSKLHELETQKVNVNRAIFDAEESAKSVLKALTTSQACELATQLRMFIHEASLEVRRRFVQTFVTEVVVTPSDVRICGPKSGVADLIRTRPRKGRAQCAGVRSFDRAWLTSDFNRLDGKTVPAS